MSISFDQSQTRVNLLRAFAGESQARNRYTFAAGLAGQQKLQVIQKLFQFTADQELAHAKVFYNHLKGLSGQNIQIDGAYPIDTYPTVLEHLKAAAHNEYQEFNHDYAEFAKIAQEEGFQEISFSFQHIAQIEKTHGDRFQRYAELLENGGLFVAAGREKWMCLNCGQILDVKEAPPKCPVCQHDQGYFIRLAEAPFQG